MRTNRFLAVLLAATMVFGSTVTSFAATDPTESATGSGEATGSGAAEGYVNTNVVKVVLPTTTTTTFAFIMDPQKMLETTNGARLGTAWKSPGANDKYVYFKTANGYANESDTVYFVNKSSGTDLDVTVTAKASPAASGTTITLDGATAAAPTVTNDEKLYLGLKVAGETAKIDTTGVSIKVTADAPTTNQYTLVYNKGYKYTDIAGATFAAVPISVEGSVTTKPTEKVAPSLSVKWSWAAHADDFAETSGVNTVKYVTNNAYNISGATLDQRDAAYGSFHGGIGAGYGGKLTITGSSASITFLDDALEIASVQYAANGTTFAEDTTNLVVKNKTVTIKTGAWKDASAGAAVKVIFKDLTDDNTDNAPAPYVFVKP